jgi:hypothetical protein
MASNDFASKLSDTATLARFLADPKGAAFDLGAHVDDVDTIRDLERLALSGQAALKSVGAASGLAMKEADWGIGAGCCNSKIMALGTFAKR